jgi:hypothetical protein
MDESTLFEPDVIALPPRRGRWFLGAIVALLAIGLIVAAAAIFRLLFAPFIVPSIDTLAADYHAHRSEFARLTPLAAQGNFVIDLKRHAARASALGTGTVTSAKEALRSIGAQRIEGYDGTLDVELGSEGLAVSGVSWGYYYSSAVPSETVSVDVARGNDAPRLWYVQLGDGWYATVYRF